MGSTALPDDATREKTGEKTGESFRTWVAALPVHTAVGRRRGQWYAIANDFCIAGMGKTKDDALMDLSGLLESYLRSVHAQGQPLESALRPLSTLARLRLLLPLKQKKRLLQGQ